MFYHTLERAVINGDKNTVKLYLENGFDPFIYRRDYRFGIFSNHPDYIVKNYVLWRAIEHGYLDIMNLLLEYGMDPRCENDYGLQCAIEYGQMDILNRLIDYGCSIENVTMSLFCFAIAKGYIDVANRIIELGFYDSLFEKNEFAKQLIDIGIRVPITI